MKVAWGIPWSSPFAWTAYLDGNMNMRCPPGCETRWFRGRGGTPARRHVHLLEQAIHWGAELICIVGADQKHPEDMLCRLVERFRQGYRVVGALVPFNGHVPGQGMKPFQKAAWKLKDGFPRMSPHLPKLDQVDLVGPGGDEMKQVNFIGSGVLMFHRDELLSLKLPWFSEMVDNENQERITNMDSRFVWRLQTEARATVWVDTTINVTHVREFEIDESYPDRFPDWEGANVEDKPSQNVESH